MTHRPEPDDDSDLRALQAVREGDQEGLVQLMDRYRDSVFRFAYRYAGNATDAQWLAEETFTKVFFKAHTFRPRGSVKSWLFAIAANHCRDFLRREKRQPRHLGLSRRTTDEGAGPEEANLADPGGDAAEQIAQQERIDEIQKAIQALPEKLRFPFVFCVLEEHSQEEAAAVIGASRKTVELRIYRARKSLQARLSPSRRS